MVLTVLFHNITLPTHIKDTYDTFFKINCVLFFLQSAVSG